MITIRKPGLLTTIQDLGRVGYQQFGVVASGVMDPLAHKVANLLVGNEIDKPTFEITLIGPTMEFHQDTLIAICGGDLSPTVNGREIPLWRPILMAKGSQLSFGSCKGGCRTYVAVAGGLDLPKIMNSYSTYLRGGIGGYGGKALQAGDRCLTKRKGDLSLRIHKRLKQRLTGAYAVSDSMAAYEFQIPLKSNASIRVMKGKEFPFFSNNSQNLFFSEPYKVGVQSDRMGYRLEGGKLSKKITEEMISEAVGFGTIQVPPDGNPIVLLADRQTIGGYPKIAQVATVDLSLVAQAKPGDMLHFQEISHEAAQRLYLQQEVKLHLLKVGIELKYR